MNKLFNKNKEAFTIIELIVVVAILGILVLLASPRLLGYVEKAELARIQHNVKVMENKMAEVLTTDNKFNDWQNNGKDLGRVVMRKELFEKQGVAKSIDWEHLSAKWLQANNKDKDNELGMGGDLIELDDKYSTYKIIPKEYSSKINTKLKGTFYVNSLGKVYYEHDKPLTKAIEKEVLACVAPSTLGYKFEIINDLGTITDWNGSATHLVIPASFKMSEGGKEWCEPVRVIGAGAFQNGNFKKVTIPQSVEEIQDEAFKGGKLIEIEIPHSVKTVGDNAFTGNPATSSGETGGSGGSGSKVIVKGSDRDISDSAFGGSTPSYSPVNAKDLGAITRIKTDSSGNKSVSIIGKTVNSDSSSSNSKDYSNTVITIPKEIEVNGELLPITEIEKGAFQGSGLVDVIMPEGLLYIHDYAFAGNQLIRAIIPNSVISIGNYAFAYNEIASEPTIDLINILQDKFIGDFKDVNNEGNISQPVSTIDLKDHIFIISSMGNHVIEDVGANPEQPDDNNDNNNDEDNNDGEEITINSADELAKIGEDEDYPLDGDYILTSDIDLSSFDNWTPIGNLSTPFTGSFDGNGYSITGLTINKPTTDYVGLFGYTEKATIKNVALEDIDITSKYYNTGGLVGRATDSSVIENSYATGSVSGTGWYTGGLVGRAEDATVTNSYATGTVIGGVSTGGLVGGASNATITNSYATGSVTGSPSTGGLVGSAHSSTKITNSYATGSVSGTKQVGGLVGVASSSTITNSYATGSVKGAEDRTGGLVGRAKNSSITNSYATGSVSGASSVGALIGRMSNANGYDCRVEYSYALNLGLPLIGSIDFDSSGSSDRNIITGSNLLSKTKMKQRNSYSGWNFNTIWQIDEGVSYPTLR